VVLPSQYKASHSWTLLEVVLANPTTKTDAQGGISLSNKQQLAAAPTVKQRSATLYIKSILNDKKRGTSIVANRVGAGASRDHCCLEKRAW